MSANTQNNAPVSTESVVTLNGAQLLQALDFIAPDRDTDPQQLECELTISFADGPAGGGYYCYCTDYPDEGAIMLDAETADDLISSDKDQALTQQTLDDVKAGIPARDAEIEALQTQQNANKVDAERYRAWRDAACKNDRTLIDAMFEYQQKHFRDGQPSPEQFDAGIDYALAAIDAARKEPGQ